MRSASYWLEGVFSRPWWHSPTCQYFIHYQNLSIQMGRYGKGQAATVTYQTSILFEQGYPHSARIPAKINDFIQYAFWISCFGASPKSPRFKKIIFSLPVSFGDEIRVSPTSNKEATHPLF